MGDLLAALPSLRLLRSAFPEARMTLVCSPAYGRLLAAAGIVDALEDADDFRWAVLASPEAARAARGSFPAAECVFGWFHSPTAENFRKGAAVIWPAAEIQAIEADPAAGVPLNRSFFEKTAAFLSRLNRPAAAFEDCARLTLPEDKIAERRTARFPASPYVVVHPGAGSRRKLWPGERFREIIRTAAGRGYSGAVVLGEAEDSLRAEWRVWNESERPEGWILWDRPTLEDLAALLAGAAFYWGNDSGPTHLAAVLGTRGAAVFRGEFSRAWNPGGGIVVLPAPDVRVLSAGEAMSCANFPGGADLSDKPVGS